MMNFYYYQESDSADLKKINVPLLYTIILGGSQSHKKLLRDCDIKMIF